MFIQRDRGFHEPGTRRRQASSVEETLPSPGVSQQRLALIRKDDFPATTDGNERVGIGEVRYVASYNWLDRTLPTILVPGVPSKWLPPGPKAQVSQDRDEYYRDVNAARFPRYPLLPAVSSILHMQPDFDTQAIEIFGCGSTIGYLLSFVTGEERTFRIGVELIGNTLFLVRQNNSPKQLIDNVHGYGHNFSATYTSWDPVARGSVSHQRIIAYTLGHLRCLVRSECDGYLPEQTTSQTQQHFGDELDDFDALIKMLDVKPVEFNDSGDLNIVPMESSTSETPQRAIFDLKTRSIKKMSDVMVDGFLPRLYVNQSPNLILAYHQSGVFEEKTIKVHDVREKVKGWEKAHTAELKRLEAVLEELRDHARTTQQAKIEVRRTGSQPLEIWTSPDDWKALSSQSMRRWEGGPDIDNADADTSDESDDGDAAYLKF